MYYGLVLAPGAAVPVWLFVAFWLFVESILVLSIPDGDGDGFELLSLWTTTFTVLFINERISLTEDLISLFLASLRLDSAFIVLFVSLRAVDKEEGVDLVKKYMELGFKVYSNDETLNYLRNKGIEATEMSLNKIIDTMPEGNINIIINTPTKGNNVGTKGFKIRRRAAEYKIPVFTCIDTAESYLKAIKVKKVGKKVEYRAMNEYFAK